MLAMTCLVAIAAPVAEARLHVERLALDDDAGSERVDVALDAQPTSPAPEVERVPPRRAGRAAMAAVIVGSDVLFVGATVAAFIDDPFRPIGTNSRFLLSLGGLVFVPPALAAALNGRGAGVAYLSGLWVHAAAVAIMFALPAPPLAGPLLGLAIDALATPSMMHHAVAASASRTATAPAAAALPVRDPAAR
jgi:hypothetical protein